MKNVVIITIILFLLAGTINRLHAQERSTAFALGLSIGVPVVGCFATYSSSPELFLFFFGITPSLGHFYAGQWGRGIGFTALRATFMVATLGAIVGAHDLATALEFFLVGVTGCCTITVADWIMVPSSVRKYNERFEIQPEIDLQNGSYGLGISYRI